jgi:hypothetical protein
MLMKAGAVIDARDENQKMPLHRAAMNGHDSTCILLTFKRADLNARSFHNLTPAALTPADEAQRKGLPSLSICATATVPTAYRCTGPSLEPRLLWNDTTQQQQDAMLNEMQEQWLATVAEGCAHARVGLTLRGAFNGGLSMGMLVHVMGYVFGGTQAHLQSCISTGRVALEARGLVTQEPIEAVSVAVVTALFASVAVVPASTKAKAGGASSGGGPMQESAQHDQEQLPPRLALVSHALALAVTPVPQFVSCEFVSSSSTTTMQQQHTALQQLVAAAEIAGGCEWLWAYGDTAIFCSDGIGSS